MMDGQMGDGWMDSGTDGGMDEGVGEYVSRRARHIAW